MEVSVLFLLFFLTVGIVTLVGLALWVWMLIDCATNEPPGNDKIVWILILIFTNWIGAIIYYLVRRPTRQHEHGR